MAGGHTPFAVLNRTGNPIVRAILRSPLHGLLSRGLALITVTGRRSGRELTIPVSYRQRGDRVTVRVGAFERKRWWRNLSHGERPVRMRIRGRERSGRGRAAVEDSGTVVVEVDLEADPPR